MHRVLCRLATYANRNDYWHRFIAQKERINLFQVEQWYMNDWERMNDLYSYRVSLYSSTLLPTPYSVLQVGYLKLAPIRTQDQQPMVAPKLLSGYRFH